MTDLLFACKRSVSLTRADEKSKASLFPEGLGIAANGATVVGLLIGAGKQIVVLIGLLGALVGVGLVLFRWGKPVDRAVLIGLAIAVIGGGAVGYRLGGGNPTATLLGSPGPSTTSSSNTASTGTTTTTGTSPASATGTTDTTAPSPATPPTVFSGEVRLTYGTGVDLDKGQTRGVEVDGPNGDIDLFMKKYDPIASASVLANGGNIYGDDGPEKNAQARCAQTLKAQEKPSLFYINNGNQYCFATSRGDTGWMRINDYSLTEGAVTDYIVLNVKVWKKAS